MNMVWSTRGVTRKYTKYD